MASTIMNIRDLAARWSDLGKKMLGSRSTYQAPSALSQDFEIDDLDEESAETETSIKGSASKLVQLCFAFNLRKLKLLSLVVVVLAIIGIYMYVTSKVTTNGSSRQLDDYVVSKSLTSEARSMAPLKTLCEQTKWQPGLIFSCDIK